ncbi:MAG TPA: Mu transposase C-terminal domain-containing protein [Nitrososphaera sp.]|jgi:hypothetical protein|nr:Mu transposase C-terminal domain-containing protein [Nitrososphaera sp.]
MWLTIDQVEELGITRRWVEKKLAAGGWEWRYSGPRGRNGRQRREVLLTSLPSELQWRWKQRQRVLNGEPQASTQEESATDTKLDGLTAALQRLPIDMREAFMAEARRLALIVERFDAMTPKRQTHPTTGKHEFVAAVLALCEEAACTDQVVLAQEPHRAQCPSPYTLDGWSRRFKKDGLLTFFRSAPCLESKKRDRRKAVISEAAVEWVNKSWRNFPSPRACYKALVKRAKKEKWKIPSEAWLYRRYKNIFPVVATAVFQGDKLYTSRHKPFTPRTVADIDALQMLCGDHHVLDVHCWIEEARLLVRLWLTAWQDIRTGLIWGYHLDTTPSSYTIGCAYANGVRNFYAQPCSRPEDGYFSYLYTDNGKDYKSKNLNGEIEVHKQAARIDGGLQMLLMQRGVGIANDADVKQFFARNYNGREKPIERAFNDLAHSIQNNFYRTGWCGRSTTDRPDSWRDLYKRHMKAVKKNQPSPFPADTAIRGFIAEWIHEYNTSQHTRSNLGGKRIVPLEEYQRLYTTRYEIKDQTLALMLMKPAQGTLKKDGVWLFGSYYWHDAMSEFKGRKGPDGKALQMEVRYTDEDYNQVWVLLPDGRIVEAVRLAQSSILNPNKETQKAVAQMIRHERQVINDFQLIAQSNLRGENVEDRVAQLIQVEQPQELPIAVNAEGEQLAPQGRVQKLTRFDGPKLRSVSQKRTVTTTEVSSVDVDSSIFDAPGRGRVSEFDFDE